MYLINPDASDPSNTWTDNTNPASVNCRALQGSSNNIMAAKGLIGGSTSRKLRKSKISRKRINNISNMYKMKGSRKSITRRVRRIKSRLRSKYGLRRGSKKNVSRRHHSRKHIMRGGYSQYMNNVPNTPSYSTGGPLSPLLSALANPVPFSKLPNINGIDNLDHNALNSFGKSGSGMGFPSRGSY
uniref:Uncharacterized protein n=1 Tax=viral metagenome TaxID=1070528 RepID=A0A6C0I6S7_9ZZZZ